MKNKPKKLNKHCRVEITQEDIDHGVACSPAHCAIAHAYKRVYGPDAVRVYGGRMSLKRGEVIKYYSLSTIGAKFEGLFDTNKSQLAAGTVVRGIGIGSRKIKPSTESKQRENKARKHRANVVMADGAAAPKKYSPRVFTAPAPVDDRQGAMHV